MVSARPFEPASRYAAHVPGTTPPRKLNGGLYTGEPFAGDWGNVPVVPDAGHISNARYFFAHDQRVSDVRHGNNHPEAPLRGDVKLFHAIGAIFPTKIPCQFDRRSDAMYIGKPNVKTGRRGEPTGPTRM